MGTSTLTTLENALKTYYRPAIIPQLDNGSGPMFAALRKTAEFVVGNKFKFGLEYGRSGGIGARGEYDDLPTPSARKYAQAEAETKTLASRFAITDKVLKTTKDNRAAFVDQVTRQMDNLVIDGNDMLRRMMVGTSTGQMGTVSADVTAAKVVTVVGTIEAFYPGQLVDILTDADTKSVDGKEIVDVDYDNSTITFGENVTVTEDQIICLAGDYGKEMTGLKDIMTATTIYGINRTNNKWFSPTVYDKYNGGVAQDLDSLWMQTAIDQIKKRTGEKPNFIVCNDGVKRAYLDEQNAYKHNIDFKDVDGGYRLIAYDDVPITDEKYMDAEIMDFIALKEFILGRLGDWDWMDDDGAIMHRINNKTAYEGTMVMYADLLCMKPASNARIKGIKEY